MLWGYGTRRVRSLQPKRQPTCIRGIRDCLSREASAPQPLFRTVTVNDPSARASKQPRHNGAFSTGGGGIPTEYALTAAGEALRAAMDRAEEEAEAAEAAEAAEVAARAKRARLESGWVATDLRLWEGAPAALPPPPLGPTPGFDTLGVWG